MDILQAARQLRPGTSWNCDIDKDGNYINLRQAEDGTPRVEVPTQEELQAVITAYVPPLSLQDQIASLQAQVATLLAKQGN